MDRRRFIAGSAFALVGVGAPDVTWTTKEQQRIAKDEADVAGLKLAVAALQAAVFPVPSRPGPPTPPTAPAAPTIIGAASGDTTATFSWSTPANGGSAITGYNFYLNGASIATPSASPYTATGLTNGTTYNGQVAAVNAIGEGPKSASVSVTPRATPSGVVGHWPGAGAVNGTTFLAALNDMTIDELEIGTASTPATYTIGTVTINVDRSSRPLLVRQASGATITFSGANGTPNGQFTFGYNGVAKSITFASGFRFDGYALGSIGIVWLGNVSDIIFPGAVVRNSVGATDPTMSWAAYVSYSGTGASNVNLDNWDVQSSGHGLSGLHVSYVTHNNIHAAGWTCDNLAFAAYCADATSIQNLTVTGWNINNCTSGKSTPSSMYFDSSAHGHYSATLTGGSAAIWNNSGGNMVTP